MNLISTIVMKEINAYAFFILEMFKNQSAIRSTKKKWDRCYRVTDKGHLKMNNEKKARTKILKNERGKTFMILFPISIERFSTVLTR